MQIDGGCHCGAVKYVADIDPEKVIVCHCVDCQILSGAAFRVVVRVPREQVKFTGTTRTYVKVAASGNQRAQVFCPDCGAHLYATSVGDDAVLGIRVGTARQRNELIPRQQIWCDSAVDWLPSLEGLPRIARQA